MGGPTLVGSQAQYFRQNQDQVMWAYERGPLVDTRLKQPHFFKWQPELGYEKNRLRKKVIMWCLAMGFGWLPLVAGGLLFIHCYVGC